MKRALVELLQLLAYAIWYALRLSYHHIAAWSRKNPTQAFTAACVIATHLTVICYVATKLPPPTVLKPRGHIAVSTIRLGKGGMRSPVKAATVAPNKEGSGAEKMQTETLSEAALARAPDAAPQTASKTPSKSKLQTIDSKSGTKKASSTKEGSCRKEGRSQKASAKGGKGTPSNEQLLQKALASLDKVSTGSHSQSAASGQDKGSDSSDAIPVWAPLTTLGNLQVEGDYEGDENGVNPQEMGYCEEMVQLLRLKMRLPDYGEVKVELTVDRQGKVSQVKVVTAKSQANRQYIESTLPTLSFPPFGTNFLGEGKHRFLFAFSNDV